MGSSQSNVRPGSTYFVTLRLADSLSNETYLTWSRETNDRILQEAVKLRRSLKASERERIIRRAHGKLERLLDEGQGSCAFRVSDVADALREAVFAQESRLYLIHSWVIMPNHLHAMVTMPVGQLVQPIAEAWKAATLTVLRRHSQNMDPWHPDVLTETVAGPTRFSNFHEYIQKNPVRAGLSHWPWVGGEGIPPINVIERWGDLSIDR